ncbi:ubiquitin-like [Trematomus bernacchii]|uniref:ubiquitin-like n=1 Tax=Trematomus bernacchii TaxID=40690 RepID=UPI00146ECEDA|nr:ubiquitin-like [Trematomus bernacchii]
MVVTIFIKGLDGKTHSVFLDDTEFQGTTVLDLKHKIEALEGISESRQRLIFRGKQLVDDFLLSHYIIEKESTIHMVIRLRGGAEPGDPGDPGLGDKDGKNRSMEKLWLF